jgi:exosome complex RNA-binding protein Rrp42 (RNase PH superfamily)
VYVTEDILRLLVVLCIQFALDDRSATVQLGTTTAMAAITAELTSPFNDRAREGSVK